MGTFSCAMEIGDPQGRVFESIEALVDPGASFTVLPESLLRRLGVAPRTSAGFELADGRVVDRYLGQTWVRVDGRSIITVVVFGSDDVGAVLGAHTLEGLLLAVDPAGQRLIPRLGLLKGAITLAAQWD